MSLLPIMQGGRLTVPDTAPCPMCRSTFTGLVTPAGESRSRVSCFSCGAVGPAIGFKDPRSWDVAAIEEWNAWSVGRAIRAGGEST